MFLSVIVVLKFEKLMIGYVLLCDCVTKNMCESFYLWTRNFMKLMHNWSFDHDYEWW